MTDIVVLNSIGKKIQTIRFEESDTKSCEQFKELMGLASGRVEYTWKTLAFKLLQSYKISDRANRKIVKKLLTGCIKYSVNLGYDKIYMEVI